MSIQLWQEQLNNSIMFLFCLLHRIFLDLSSQLESLRLAAEFVAGFVNARGVVPVVCLYDVSNRVREVALHGVRHGAAMALAIAQARSGHKL